MWVLAMTRSADSRAARAPGPVAGTVWAPGGNPAACSGSQSQTCSTFGRLSRIPSYRARGLSLKRPSKESYTTLTTSPASCDGASSCRSRATAVQQRGEVGPGVDERTHADALQVEDPLGS